GDGSAMFFDNPVDDRGPQAGALPEIAAERLGVPPQLFLAPADSFVPADDPQDLGALAYFDPQESPVRHRLDGVGGEVPEHLLDPVHVHLAPDLGARGDDLDIAARSELGAVAQELGRVLEETD